MLTFRVSNLFLLCLLGQVFCASVAYSATFYVDNAVGANCANNAGNGTEEKPWCTVGYGLSNMNGGDTLLVKSGTYDETLYISSRLSGTEGQPTVIKNYPGSSPVLRGTGINSGRAKITGCDYLVFDGFGVTFMNQGIYVESSSQIMIKNCEVFDVGQEAIHVNGNSEFVLIEGCSVHDTGKWTANGEGIYVGTGSAGPVDHSNNVIIRNNTVFDISTDEFGGEAIELKPGTHDCMVEGNLIYNSRSVGNAGAIEINESRLGVQFWNTDPNHIVRNNILHHTGTAIRAGTGCLVYNNVIYALVPGSYGILVNNNANDTHARRIYHNTIDADPSAAYRYLAGTVDLQNNIGPVGGSNLSATPALFVASTFEQPNYELAIGSSAIDGGADLLNIVADDFNGIRRTIGLAPDIGAFEYSAGQPEQNKQLRFFRQPTTEIDTITIDWPSSLTGAVLQQNSALSPTGWEDVVELPIDNGMNMRTSFPIGEENRFFRLRPIGSLAFTRD